MKLAVRRRVNQGFAVRAGKFRSRSGTATHVSGHMPVSNDDLRWKNVGQEGRAEGADSGWRERRAVAFKASQPRVSPRRAVRMLRRSVAKDDHGGFGGL